MTQDKIINFAEHNIPATRPLGVVWNDDMKEFFFTNSWGYDTTFLNDLTKLYGWKGTWKYDYADKNLQKDIDFFQDKGCTLINKVKYLITYNDDKLYTKEYLLLLVNKMKGLL